ncbi:type II toxin-antitoxin system RelE family toxin [Salininema proteolyticum]|uniref:Type II toxin-antitoxin system RelE/ParE family toxin n=1 Tax=Salininema proteolyticum TaxID=1607685 RepID=A0ABV8TWM5_9ACTN
MADDNNEVGQWRVEVSKRVEKQIGSLDKSERRRVLLALDRLSREPRPDGVRKLAGRDNEWRIRVGRCRIIYEIHDGRLVVIVLDILSRDKAYKRR